MTAAPRRPSKILVADDDPAVREALRLLLSTEGFEVVAVRSAGETLSAVETETFDLALIDLNYTHGNVSGRDGLELLDRIAAVDAALPVVVMTAWSTVAGAVNAMRLGARDYVEKPWDDQRLLASIQGQLNLRRALVSSRRLEEANHRLQDRDLPEFIAQAESMKPVLDTVHRVAASDASVLITGEHGTGKEVVATLLHRLSNRNGKPFVTMNAGGLPSGVAESELFGHVKGAFTDARSDRIGCFELADEGTLFLDEIANMAVELQPTLLRVLQTGEVRRLGASRIAHVNVRVLSATNSDLPADIARGAFREDLLYRLNTISIRLPPLRSRRADIMPLAEMYLARYAQKYRRGVTGFSRDAIQALLAHSWPGNVRELCHAIERAVLMTTASAVAESHLALTTPVSDQPLPEDSTLEAVERAFIEQVIARHNGDIRSAATQLGLSRSALYRRLQRP
jgi:DNA-binding NtrC family response regulator